MESKELFSVAITGNKGPRLFHLNGKDVVLRGGKQQPIGYWTIERISETSEHDETDEAQPKAPVVCEEPGGGLSLVVRAEVARTMLQRGISAEEAAKYVAGLHGMLTNASKAQRTTAAQEILSALQPPEA